MRLLPLAALRRDREHVLRQSLRVHAESCFFEYLYESKTNSKKI
jgi:hypothetical protein